MRRRVAAALLAGAMFDAGAAEASARQAPAPAADTMSTEAQRLTRFETALAAQPSATKVLEDWCAHLNAVDHAPVTATPVTGADAPLPHDVRALLAAAPDAPLGYRHVRLDCTRAGAPLTLSEAHNWYLPGLLSPVMNATLTQTRTPFGTVVAPLGFTRKPLTGTRGPGEGCPPGTVLTHRALLRLPDGRPLALLLECYTRGVLAVGPER